VEDSRQIETAFIIQEEKNLERTVTMKSVDLDDKKWLRLPFVKPSGSQSPAVGPVIKRTDKKKGTPPYGPTHKILKTTQNNFTRLAESGESWADYFTEIGRVLTAEKILWQGEEVLVGENEQDKSILAAACRLIPANKTVFLVVADTEGKWPGDRREYLQYLESVVAEGKYVTDKAPKHAPATCPLCGAKETVVFPNALKGAGINLSNMDRVGAFASLDVERAWKAYGLCLDCADLLYIFKNHLAKNFVGRVAGRKALLIPSLLGNPESRELFLDDLRKYVKQLEGRSIVSQERYLIDFFADRRDAHVVLHILWATVGQEIDDVVGVISDVLPSRLQDLVYLNRYINGCRHPCFPDQTPDEALLDLGLNVMGSLFKRVGGSKGKGETTWQAKRMTAEALYHGESLKDLQKLLWDEIVDIANSYLSQAVNTRNTWGLVNENITVREGQVESYSLAGWVRHMARFLYYLDQAEVLLMNDEMQGSGYEPEMGQLKPYFTVETGINSREKAFAFLLGILFGKLIQVQGARGVNVAGNALTWLKRLQLTGKDLPELYVKVREKLLAYDTEKSTVVRDLVQEIGRLGSLLGDDILLDRVPTCYYLLLGQSLTVKILPSAKTDDEAEKKGVPTDD